VGASHEDAQHWSNFYRPDVSFFCDVDYDPFLVMQDQNKVYGRSSDIMSYIRESQPSSGFTISLYEYQATIPTLWGHVKGKRI